MLFVGLKGGDLSPIVKLENIDGVIWNLDQKVSQIIATYQQFGKVIIFLCNEGPDGYKLGLYKILDFLCEQFNFDEQKIIIQTGNQIETHSKYKIEIAGPAESTEYIYGQNIANNVNIDNKQLEKHFGIFIGRSNWKRLYISSVMNLKYKEQSLQTFHYDSKSEYHKTHLGLEKLIHIKGPSVLNLVEPLLSSSPLTLDQVTNFPIINPINYNIIHYYKKFFVEIVCETYSTGNTFFPTEKIWRPILCKTPFIVQGPIGFLANLKKLGFKTFDRWWDESYDEDDEQTALDTVLRNINNISQYSVSRLNDLYKEMADVVEHNYKTFISLNDQTFKLLKYDQK